MQGNILYRPVWLPVVITAAMLMIALGLLQGTASRSLNRLQHLHTHLERLSEAQKTSLHIQRILVPRFNNSDAIAPADMDAIRDDLNRMLNVNRDRDVDISAALLRARDALNAKDVQPRQALIIALQELGHVLKAETTAHDTLVGDAKQAAQLELDIASGMMLALPALALLIMFLVRNRILLPLKNLGWLMSQLARKDFSAATAQDIDPMLKPLIDNYNTMVQRLAELEREHQARRETLESQVGAAARTLLDQQRTLANAERLAAVGEVAARLAHELRNPLAGMQMALTNLQQETTDPEHVERLGMVTNELVRITALLNSLLDQSRHQPEPSRAVPLAPLVHELLTLARYQVPEKITIHDEVPDGLSWRLPENELRRTLLNLVLNACQAIGDRAGNIRVQAKNNHGQLVLEVCDDGPGFTQPLLQMGIRPFSSTRPDGTGLGLAAVQRFAQNLQGNVHLHNIQPHGASVTLTLPDGEHHD
jgi:two-component system NtrC family sensor kinase